MLITYGNRFQVSADPQTLKIVAQADGEHTATVYMTLANAVELRRALDEVLGKVLPRQ